MNKKTFLMLLILIIGNKIKSNDDCPCKREIKKNKSYHKELKNKQITKNENFKNFNEKITTKNLSQIINNLPVVISVIPNSAYKNCHIKGSINIPIKEIENKTKKWSKNKSIFVYCLFETNSTKAYNKLKELGFYRTKIIEGGLNKWIEDNLSISGNYSKTIPKNEIIEKLYKEINSMNKNKDS